MFAIGVTIVSIGKNQPRCRVKKERPACRPSDEEGADVACGAPESLGVELFGSGQSINGYPVLVL
jgi:hypothetical protein